MPSRPPPFSVEASHPPAWHALPADAILNKLASRPSGLDDAEVRGRLQQYGRNELEPRRTRPWWLLVVDQVRSMVVWLLAAAAAVALVGGDLAEGVSILAVLLINGALGFAVEWRARQAMDALRRLEVQRATVRRDGRVLSIDARELVPGDVLVVEAGEAVAADARVIEAQELSTVEAALTGESLPTYKDAQAVSEEAVLAERSSMLYKGTLVAVGSGLAVVVATGRHTEIGAIGELVASTETEDTPLERRLDVLGSRLVWVTLAIAAVTIGLGLLRGHEVWLMVETGLALAVAAVPEGLPVVATLTLALGMNRMARRNALVRRLPAVEALGSVTDLCVDKTGTLTAGEMTVARLLVGNMELAFTGSGYRAEGELVVVDGGNGGGESTAAEHTSPAEAPAVRRALEVAVLANRARIEIVKEAPRVFGDPTEAALLVAADKVGVDRAALRARWPEVGEVPFSSARMLMATFHRSSTGETLVCVKGAPQQLLERATELMATDGTQRPLDQPTRDRLLEANARLAGEGLRVLALACKRSPASGAAPAPGEERVDVREDWLKALVFVGLVGILDPPAPGVSRVIESMRRAGIRVVMITGDQAATAEAVARELGVLGAGETALDGGELSRLEDAELAERAATVTVFSRTAPVDKLRIVEALQARGEIVGMLGDGVNDAPALKRADIGVALGGRGTDVAKETAALVLVDDAFESVAAAVQEGRVIFDNIRKFVHFLFSCNLSEILVLTAASASSLPLPLLPLQILWLNLVTDVFPALALAVEPGDPDVMRRPPRPPSASILSRGFVLKVLGEGAVMTASVLAVFVWGLSSGRGPENTSRAVTMTFMTLALAQLFHLFDSRSDRAVVLSRRLFSNRWALGALGLTLGLQGLAVYWPPLASLLGTVRLGLGDWWPIAVCSLTPVVVGQLARALAGIRAASRSRGWAPESRPGV